MSHVVRLELYWLAFFGIVVISWFTLLEGTTDMSDNRSSLVAQILDIDSQMKTLKSRRSELAAQLIESVNGKTGKIEVSTGSFTVAENNRYDTDIMEANLLPGQIRRCTVSKIDGATVKRLYPEAYEAAKKNVGLKVTVRK